MSNEKFTKLYNETHANRYRLYDAPIAELKVWFVEADGLGNVMDVKSCHDFASNTKRGSVVISGILGPLLKVSYGFWVRIAPSTSNRLWDDIDIVKELIDEYEDNDYIATVIDPGV